MTNEQLRVIQLVRYYGRIVVADTQTVPGLHFCSQRGEDGTWTKPLTWDGNDVHPCKCKRNV